MNWEWFTTKAVPVLWLWTAFIIVGACVGIWLR